MRRGIAKMNIIKLVHDEGTHKTQHCVKSYIQ